MKSYNKLLINLIRNFIKDIQGLLEYFQIYMVLISQRGLLCADTKKQGISIPSQRSYRSKKYRGQDENIDKFFNSCKNLWKYRQEIKKYYQNLS